MSDSALVVLWLIGGTALAWLILTRLQTWLRHRFDTLDEVSRAPKDDERANDLVRLWGFGVAGGGAAAVVLGSGWTIAGFIPLQLFGVFSLGLGGWMFSFPAKYREIRKRYRQ
jgi:hypothetical protein